MAATPKHRRSKSKRNMTRASDRYDKVLTKYKKMKKNGGKFLIKSKISGELVPAHKVSKSHSEYRSVKVVNSK